MLLKLKPDYTPALLESQPGAPHVTQGTAEVPALLPRRPCALLAPQGPSCLSPCSVLPSPVASLNTSGIIQAAPSA